MDDPVAVAGFETEADALMALGALGRSGVEGATEEEVGERWVVKVAPDRLQDAMVALSRLPPSDSRAASEPDLVSIRARSSSSSSLGLAWVGLGVAITTTFAYTGSLFDGLGLVSIAILGIVTVVALLVWFGRGSS